MTRDPQERFWDRFPPQSPAGLLIELVAPERPFDESAVAAVRLMWMFRADVPWKDLVDAVSSRVGAGFASEAIVHLLAALHILVDEPHAVDALRAFVTGRVAEVQLSDDIVQADPAVSGAWIYTILRFDPKLELLSRSDSHLSLVPGSGGAERGRVRPAS